MAVSDSVSSGESGVAASSKAVKTAYDMAVEAKEGNPPAAAAGDKGKVLAVGEGGVMQWAEDANAFPMPRTEAGIGQVLQVSGRTVPSGGTWLVWAFCSTAISATNGLFFPGGYSGSAALIGVYPGGATVPLSSTSATLSGMLCWRIA